MGFTKMNFDDEFDDNYEYKDYLYYDNYDNDNKADMERIRQSIRKRKRNSMKIKKLRQKKLRRIKRFVILVSIVFIVCIFGTVGIIHGGDSEIKDSISERETLQVAVGNIIKPEIIQETKIAKVEKSSNYVNIDSEKVNSPYISLIDVKNNQLIAGRESEEKIYPASMTKVMTLIIAVENVKDRTSSYTFGYDMLNRLYIEEASVAGFLEDETIDFDELLYGLILPSGADAAEGLAELIAGSQDAFVELMNKKCKELNLTNTHFMNVSGLYDDNQYTTCTEMAMIMSYAMKNAECAKVLSTYQYTTKATKQHPEGILLTSTMFSRMYGTEVEGVTITAGKTGYTNEARHCMVSYATKNGNPYICVTAYALNKWHSIFDSFEIYGNYLP